MSTSPKRRFWVLSDLHLYNTKHKPLALTPPENIDGVVLAGDTDKNAAGVEWAKRTFSDLPVITVAGNHEYIGFNLPSVENDIAHACQNSNVHFLQNTSTTIAGVTFLGCTLWTNLELFGDSARATEFALGHTDFLHIQNGEKRLRPEQWLAMHNESMRWLSEKLAERRGPYVIVTHYCPTARAVPESYLKNPYSPCYSSNLDEFIETCGASHWIFGHLHIPYSGTIGKTKLICNPRGNPDDAGNGFNPSLVIEV